MEHCHKLVEKLNSHLASVQAKNKSYSLRAFARDLGLQAPVLSEVLRGKRKLTPRMAEGICDRLLIDSQERRQLLQSTTKSSLTPLDMNQFRVISDWQYFAILSAYELDSPPHPAHLAKALQLSKTSLENAIKLLKDLGLLSTVKGKTCATGKQFVTTQDIPDVAIKKNHVQGFELAKEAMFQVEPTRREFSANTIAVDSSKIEEAKDFLRRMRRTFYKKFNTGKKDCVYRMQMQFFPILEKENDE